MTPPRALLRDSVYVRIRDAIVSGTFAPGERIRDLDLVDWLGVSRTPIREAFLRLERAGLLETRPGQATTVTPVDSAATRNAQDVAAALHALAAELAAGRLAADDLARMESANAALAAAVEAGDVDAALLADDGFHAAVLAVCGNPRIGELLEEVAPLVRRVERLRFASIASRDSVTQHARIIELLRSGDGAGAAVATRANWQTLVSTLDAAGSPPEPSRRRGV